MKTTVAFTSIVSLTAIKHHYHSLSFSTSFVLPFTSLNQLFHHREVSFQVKKWIHLCYFPFVSPFLIKKLYNLRSVNRSGRKVNWIVVIKCAFILLPILFIHFTCLLCVSYSYSHKNETNDRDRCVHLIRSFPSFSSSEKLLVYLDSENQKLSVTNEEYLNKSIFDQWW